MTNHRRDKSTKPKEIEKDLLGVHNSQSEEIEQIFFGKGTEELTDMLIDELVASGWEKASLVDYKNQGFRYNRHRNTLFDTKTHFEGVF